MAEEFYKKLLEEQRVFTMNVLKEQKAWMDNFAKRSPGQDSTPVPAFVQFNSQHQKWDSYLEQLKQHFSAYAVIDANKQKSFFLSWLGSDAYETLKKLVGVDELQKQTFNELSAKLTEFYKEKVHVVAARYEFHKAEMGNRTYKEWIAELRSIARQCDFVCKKENCLHDFSDDMIRDKLILKSPHDAVRTAALQKQQPTLAEVQLIAESFETTTKTVSTIKDRTDTANAIDSNGIYSMTTKNTEKFSMRNKNKKNQKSKYRSCTGCGVSHNRDDCKFRSAVCRGCGKTGHIIAVCLSNEKKQEQKQNKGSKNIKGEKGDKIDYISTAFSVASAASNKSKKQFVQIVVNGKETRFQMDSGAEVSVITLDTYEMLNKPPVKQCSRVLYGYGHTQIETLGEIAAKIQYGSVEKILPLVVSNVRGSNNLLGVDLFEQLGFKIVQVDSVTAKSNAKLHTILSTFADVFTPALGTMKSVKASIRLKENAVPKFIKSRPIPFAQLQKFKDEAQRLSQAGIWKQITFSDWASPIVLATKPDGSIRICGDFKKGVNQQIDVDQYPLPTRECLLHTIRYGKYFSKIDLRDAYLQMELDEDSKKVLVVNTPLGLFQYQRLPYGVASAPAMFQKHLEQLLCGVDGCANYIDDIIVAGASEQEHIERLAKVLHILQSAGIRCKKEKCEFLKTKLTYLGREISADGILPDESGIQAVKNLRRPKTLKELEAFMGKINYYHNFIPNYSQLAAPMNKLRRKGASFQWKFEQENAFNLLKQHIIKATMLAHFREDLPIVVATDASSYGVGAVLSHINPDGTEQPIAFASKTLNRHQENYSQIEKEGLAIIFGVKKFHQFLYGRKFTLITDHKPLVSIFSPDKNLPTMTAQRIQRWAITLMGYQFQIKYRKTTNHANADALSRLPSGPDEDFDNGEINQVVAIQTPIDIEVIRKSTNSDKILQRVKKYIQKGWPHKLSPNDQDLRPYFNRKLSLITQNDLILLQRDVTRVTIPYSLRDQVLRRLHDGHWGVVKMKQLARQHCWWDGIDNDIARIAAGCENCKLAGPSDRREYSNWPEPQAPWQRVHIDFAGPVFGSMWLLCIDAFSQFPFVYKLANTTTESTIFALTTLFASEGLPETIVSDNGPQLTADAFKTFCHQNAIKHITIAPFHPPSNGLAERFVRTFKTAVKKNIDDGLQVNESVLKFLSSYRTMPNAKGISPAHLLHGRPARTLFSQMFSVENDKTDFKQTSIKFSPNESVYIRNYGRGEKWLKGVVDRHLGKVMYVVRTSMGYFKRHQNQMKFRLVNDAKPVEDSRGKTDSVTNILLPDTMVDTANEHSQEQPRSPLEVRRSGRIRRSVHRYQAEDFRN
ncbi:uncharacterized protein K02A2.6-like [Anastrepha obliqua]|uniref:uncharacterized protein K02A2.6-like n=1 Tax=Anastrepha obliqua TaxID=95512 RepID=UPI0024098442|nr:uncharacterized protein K02A2.6-like [Anastrepha obliqua]